MGAFDPRSVSRGLPALMYSCMKRRRLMQIVYERCAGLDVHKKAVMACLITPAANGERRKERRTFSTMTADLVRLRDWLTEQQCSQVAMESTGVFWRPIFNILEGHLEVMVVNAEPHQGRAGKEDRHQRRRMDCRPPPTRPLTPQLYPSGMAAHCARTDPLTRQSE